MNDLIDCSILIRVLLSFLHLSFFQEVRQVLSLLILDFEVVIDHCGPQPV
jgi:hypothetical protein